MRDELDAIVDRMASSLGRSILVADRTQRVISYSASEEDADPIRIQTILDKKSPAAMQKFLVELGIDRATDVSRAPANRQLESSPRVCIPVRLRDRFFGYLWLLDPRGDLRQEDLELARTDSRMIAELLFRDQQLRDAQHHVERQLVDALLSPDEAVRHDAQARIIDHDVLEIETFVRAVVVSLPSSGAGMPEHTRSELDEIIGNVRWLWPPRRLAALTRSDHCVLLLACTRYDDAKVREFVARLRKEFERHGPVSSCDAGIGSLAILAEAPRTYDEAKRAALVARAVHRFDHVAEWDKLGVYRILSSLRPGAAIIDPMVERLIEADPDGSLVDTLETVLDLGGDVRAASEQLCMHRTSLYYRLHKVEGIIGASLKDGDACLNLQMGLKLARLEGRLPQTRSN